MSTTVEYKNGYALAKEDNEQIEIDRAIVYYQQNMRTYGIFNIVSIYSYDSKDRFIVDYNADATEFRSELEIKEFISRQLHISLNRIFVEGLPSLNDND